MKRFVLSLAALATVNAAKFKSRLRPAAPGLPTFYHTTEELRSELQALAERCPALSLRTVSRTSLGSGRSVALDVVTIKAPNTAPKNKVFMLFGEHARELISAESGLHFAKTVCDSSKAGELLQDSEFLLVVNANPGSRARVEQGDWCLRVGPGGVDLNRNWDEHWQGAASYGEDTNPGQLPFSEPETQLLKELVSEYQPTTFFTIHSGTLGMYMPWAFDMDHLANRNQASMMEILKEVDQDHCECPFGAAGREVGYSCPGTCLDWVYDKLQTPYAFAYEIYFGGDQASLRERWQEKVGLPETSSLQAQNLAHDHFKDMFRDFPSSFIQVQSSSNATFATNEVQGFACFGAFNPDTEEKYRETVENWSQAYLDTVAKVSAKLP
mmetsp:Transcript_16647/g.31497  ORF Transcript_16647/g.31497 Transcript_16647/m.31497 type:complete len:383 (-) Transcript_16647:44-1192(-)